MGKRKLAREAWLAGWAAAQTSTRFEEVTLNDRIDAFAKWYNERDFAELTTRRAELDSMLTDLRRDMETMYKAEQAAAKLPKGCHHNWMLIGGKTTCTICGALSSDWHADEQPYDPTGV